METKNKWKFDAYKNLKLANTNVKGTFAQNVDTGELILRLFLTKEQKEELLLQSGELKGVKVVVL